MPTNEGGDADEDEDEKDDDEEEEGEDDEQERGDDTTGLTSKQLLLSLLEAFSVVTEFSKSGLFTKSGLFAETEFQAAISSPFSPQFVDLRSWKRMPLKTPRTDAPTTLPTLPTPPLTPPTPTASSPPSSAPKEEDAAPSRIGIVGEAASPSLSSSITAFITHEITY